MSCEHIPNGNQIDMNNYPTVSCIYHQSYYITNFCSDLQCLLPLCPQCVKVHIQEHRQKNTYGEIDTIDSIYEKTISQVNLCHTYYQQKQENVDLLIMNKQHVINELDQKMNDIKQSLHQQIETAFEKIQILLQDKANSVINDQIDQLAKIKEQNQEKEVFFDQYLVNLANQQKCLKYLIKFYNDGIFQSNQQDIRNLDRKIDQIQNSEISLHVNEEKLKSFSEMIAQQIVFVTQSGEKPIPIITRGNINHPITISNNMANGGRSSSSPQRPINPHQLIQLQQNEHYQQTNKQIANFQRQVQYTPIQKQVINLQQKQPVKIITNNTSGLESSIKNPQQFQQYKTVYTTTSYPQGIPPSGQIIVNGTPLKSQRSVSPTMKTQIEQQQQLQQSHLQISPQIVRETANFGNQNLIRTEQKQFSPQILSVKAQVQNSNGGLGIRTVEGSNLQKFSLPSSLARPGNRSQSPTQRNIRQGSPGNNSAITFGRTPLGSPQQNQYIQNTVQKEPSISQQYQKQHVLNTLEKEQIGKKTESITDKKPIFAKEPENKKKDLVSQLKDAFEKSFIFNTNNKSE